jgi:hypothetical protein
MNFSMVIPKYIFSYLIINWKFNKKDPLYRVGHSSEPAFAGGTLSTSFALAEAYRGTDANVRPFKKVLAQNR